MKKIVSMAVIVTLVGCSTPPPASYSSPALYSGLDCYQMASEALRIQQAAQAQAASKSSKDTMTGVAVVAGLLLFWPALFLIQGTGAEQAELTRLKAEADALQQAATMKRCPLQQVAMPDPAPPPGQPVGAKPPGMQ